MKKTFKRLHLWLAFPFGLILFLICFSGAMIEFAGEFSEWAYHDRYEAHVTPQGRLPLPVLMQRVQPHLAPGVTVTGVSIPTDSTRNYEFSLSAPPRTEWLIDPYTGRVAGPKEHLPFFEVMFKLHRWLLDFPHEGEGIWWGKLIVGVSTLMFLFVLITGLVAFGRAPRAACANSSPSICAAVGIAAGSTSTPSAAPTPLSSCWPWLPPV